MLILLFQFFLIPVQIVSQPSNFFCNGDFESYTYIDDSGGEQNYSFEDTVYSSGKPVCWYNSHKSDPFEIKYKLYPPVGRVAELFSDRLYILCQSMTLPVNTNFTLQFTVANIPYMRDSEIQVFVNTLTVGKFYTKGQNTIATYNLTFVADQAENEICFKPNFYIYYPYPQYEDSGPVLDNVSLVITPINSSQVNSTLMPLENSLQPIETTNNFSYLVSLKLYYNPSSNTILLASSFDPQTYGLSLSQLTTYKTVINGKPLQGYSEYCLNSYGHLQIKLACEYFYTGSEMLAIQILPTIVDEIVLGYQIHSKEIDLSALTEQQKNLFQNIEPKIGIVGSYVKIAFVYLNLSHLSYLLASFIEFWGLTLLYSFLAIRTIPDFAYRLMQQLISHFFSSASISAEIERVLYGVANEDVIPRFSLLTRLEKVDGTRGDRIWLGFIGATSNFVNNNFGTIHMLGFSLIKILLFEVLRLLFKSKIRVLRKVKPHDYVYTFGKEIICFLPLMVISALETLLNMGENNFLGKLNNVLQTNVIPLAVSVQIFSLLVVQHLMPDPMLRSKKHARMLSLRKQGVLTLALNIAIPSLIILSHVPSFFAITSLLLLLKCLNFYHSFYLKQPLQRISSFMSCMCWVVYHLCFCLFAIVDRWLYDHQLDSVLKYAGLVAIGCILFGGLVNLFIIIIDLLLLVQKMLRLFFCRVNPTKMQKETKMIAQTDSRTLNLIDKIEIKMKVARHKVKDDFRIREAGIGKEIMKHTSSQSVEIFIPACRNKKIRSPKMLATDYFEAIKKLKISTQ